MSYFGSEKRLLLSISALSSSASQIIGTTATDINVFNAQIMTQLASSIGYPSISSASQQITLEAGWHYSISLRIKVDGVDALGNDHLLFYISDTSNNAISSIGRQIVYRDSSALIAQENCIAYIDSTSQATVIKCRAQRIGSAVLTINQTTDAGASAFRSHLLIKAWK